jgi:hypothetical protein
VGVGVSVRLGMKRNDEDGSGEKRYGSAMGFEVCERQD